MTESDGTPHPGPAAPEEPQYADRVYRSGPGIISGVLLLAVAAWLIGDAVISGTGRTPWVALAAAPVFVFPVIAYTLRPAVCANERRLLVRNPLRSVHAPWSQVEGLRSGYSVELFAAGTSTRSGRCRCRSASGRRRAAGRCGSPRTARRRRRCGRARTTRPGPGPTRSSGTCRSWPSGAPYGPRPRAR
ncbi:PH domain-containing protein [Kitasatospora arboriphila]